MSEQKTDILVYAHFEEMDAPQFMGVLTSVRSRGKETFSFSYGSEWLKSNRIYSLDPDLQFYAGPQYLNDEKPNFGLFLDSSPDRWGRVLLKRREAALAKAEGRSIRQLFETDYLLGVYDATRMGALRFKRSIGGEFLDDNPKFSAPPWTSIRTLEEMTLRLEREDALDDPDYLQWLNMLIAPGSSLGGARPKANVLYQNQHPWIAKFPNKNDHSDIGAWEWITHQMAKDCGIQMSEAKAKRYSSKHHTFITKRFDRTNSQKRIHFASAMTLLGHNDGQHAEEGASYLELVEFIMSNGAQVEQDLEELWRRIVFSICISNTDDHLRNHGFLLTQQGWVLSPAYDLNPNEDGNGLSLNITEYDNALDLDLAMEVHEYFRLSKEKALNIIDTVQSSVRSWKDRAKSFGLSKLDIELKARAFNEGEKSF